MRYGPRTLRSTLAFWLALAPSVGLIVLSAAVVNSRRTSFKIEMDSALEERAKEMVARILADDVTKLTDERLRNLVPAEEGHVFCAVREEHGELLFSWNVQRHDLLPPLPGVTPSGPLVAASVSLPAERARELAQQDAPLTAVTMPFRDRDHLYFLQLAARDRSWTHSLEGIVAFVSIGLLLLLIGAPLTAQVIARRVMSPIHGLVEAAKGVSPSNPGGRFQVRTTDVELRKLEEELNAALQRMEEGYRAQSQFVSNVAHELKTPIAALIADTQVLRIGRTNAKETKAFLDRAEEELKHLSGLVESFLVMARIDTQARRKDLLYVDDVVRRAGKRSEELARKSGVRIEMNLTTSTADCDPFVSGDLELLQAMVENLIRNAVHHSPVGAPVSVETRCSAGEVQILVRDRGPGIPEEYRLKVFERGVRLPEGAQKDGGAGLGLAIASNIAQLHGGSVSVEPTVGDGCSFVVTLPAVQRTNGVQQQQEQQQ